MRRVCLFLVFCLVMTVPSARAFAQTDFKPAFGLEAHKPKEAQSSVPTPNSRMENWDGTEKVVVKVEQDSGPHFNASVFNKHRKKFNTLCKAMRADGRSDAMSVMMELNAYKDDSCPACRPLLSTLASACRPEKPRPTKSDKEKGITPTPIPKQREPNAATLDATALLFSAIYEGAHDSEAMPEVVKAMQRLKTILGTAEGKTQAEWEYFDMVNHLAFKPFEEYVNEQKRIKEKGPSFSESNGPKLDDLFNF